MNVTKVTLAALMSLLLLTNAASAAIRPALTRVVALESDKETSIKLINDDKSQDYLVQSWIEDLNGNDKNLPLVLTPPLFKIGAGREGKLRMVIIPGKLPQDRESVYWLWIQEIPPVSKSKGNQLQVAVRTHLKIFIRPGALKEKPADTVGKLQWQASYEGGKYWLVAKNPTEYSASFSELSVSSGGKAQPIADKNVMVPPKGEARYLLPTGVGGKSGTVNYSVINDFGGESAVLHQSF
ncbi:fimbrial biogenesis chaperone [Ewingella americana]|uniref:Molecular chaperone n=1 Tax=Ewingella americana TaxID=41202 RepID=A0A502GBK5_9GAMM|nr:molecular chaperone [Ewingella americana]TPG58868.1 molecular chaperone [Ewingella americana]